jgi:hypothetical protein
MKSSWNRRALVIFVLESAFAATAGAETVSLAARKNNTIYSESENTNGGGQHFFVGTTHISSHPYRRSIISFDVAGSIPVGSTIEGVTLTLHMSRTLAPGADPITVYLHRCLVPWGEGTVVAPGEEGQGGPAQPGDATWTYNAFLTSRWSTPGADYASTPSGSTYVSNEIGFKVWSSAPRLVADVQSWLDSPQNNYGWVLVGERETAGIATTKRFDSRHNVETSFRPVLQIDYTPGVTDGGTDGGELDAGVDAGVNDAGVTDAGVDGGQDSGQDTGTGSPNAGPSRMSSGCQIAPGSFLAMVGVALLALSQSRRRGRTTLAGRE